MPAIARSRSQLRLLRTIYGLATPVALSHQVDNLVGIADIYMVGRLGPDAISAVGISRVLIMVVSVVMLSVTTGAFAMVAQFVGAGKEMEASATAKQAISLVGGTSVVLSLIGLAAAPLSLRALSLSPPVVAQGTLYLRTFFAGMVFLALNFAVRNCMYGAGDTRTPLYINLFVSIIKLAASYVLIFGFWRVPAMGIVGAAAGTVVARICGFAMGLIALYSGRLPVRLLRGTTYLPDLSLARRILRIGIPAALQGLFRNGSGVVFVKLVALTQAGPAAVAAFSIGNQMERVLRRTSLAFGTTATTLVGQSLGHDDPEDAKTRGWATIVAGTLTMAALGVPVALFARPLLGLFTDVPEVIRIGVVYFYAMALAEPFMCLAIAAGGGLRGAGDTKPALYYTLIAQWLIRLPVGYALAFLLGFDIQGLWAALVVFSALQGLLTVRKFGRGEWREREI